jgi:O-glycosyl hydrolase
MKYLFAIILCWALVAGDALAQNVTVNLNAEKQLIKGFGGINHPIWYRDLNTSERELAFGNDAGQMGLTVLRNWVSDNPNQWNLDLPTAQRAVELGVTVFASPWNPPSQMTTTDGAGQKHINPAYYGDYADHLNDYVEYMRNNGVDLYAISTQNEPDYAHDWTEWTPQQSVDFIKGYADRISTRLMTPESFQYRKNIYDAILNDATALSKVDIFGTHLYGTQYRDFPYPLFEQKGAGKELWMTEVYTDSKYDANIWADGYINDDRHALKVAEHIHYAMVDGNFQTYVFWPIRRYYALIHDGSADSFGNSASASAGTITKRGYCMAQFSKWVRPGFVRVEATKSPSTNVFVSAYKKDDEVVIVVVNKNTSTRNITIDIPGTSITTWAQYTTSATKNVAKGSDINASTSLQVTLDAASVTTFVGKGNPGTPDVQITSPLASETFVAPATIEITATATDQDGSISKVEFYNGISKLGEVTQAPYSFTWEAVSAGEHTITVIATDNESKTAQDEITIVVNIPQGPYTGTAHAIPGTIELEEYDEGGNGFAYYDIDAGTNVDPAPDFRTQEDVDIETCTDTDGGYNIGWAASGEWLEYTTNVTQAGSYALTLRVACNGDGRTVSITSNGEPIATNIAIPNTGGWQEWQDVVVPNITLAQGEQVLRLTIGDSNYVNLNKMTFTSEDPVTALTPVATSACQISVHSGVFSVQHAQPGVRITVYNVHGDKLGAFGHTGGALQQAHEGVMVLQIKEPNGTIYHKTIVSK